MEIAGLPVKEVIRLFYGIAGPLRQVNSVFPDKEK
jgi:hypothetical protein